MTVAAGLHMSAVSSADTLTSGASSYGVGVHTNSQTGYDGAGGQGAAVAGNDSVKVDHSSDPFAELAGDSGPDLPPPPLVRDNFSTAIN